MRRHDYLILGAALLVVGPSCVKEVCREDSAKIELAVKFAGFDLSEATRLEIEVHLKAPGPANAGGMAYAKASVASLAFPDAAVTPNGIQYIFDAGKYVSQVVKVDEVRLFFRAYGKTGNSERLLAEGIYVTTDLAATGCFRQQSVTVQPTSTCEHKYEGDPCVQSGGAGVCKGGVPLVCSPSACGGTDRYTDRRAGEICDPSQSEDSTLLLACTDACLPVAAIVSADQEPRRREAFPGLSINLTGITEQTSVEGFYALERGANPLTLGDRVGRLVFADFDGDSQTELAIGVPGGSVKDPGGTEHTRVGVTLVQDPIAGSGTVGAYSKSRLFLAGAPARTGGDRSWFGSAVAAGDVNGDGIDDLVIGAPMAYTVGGSANTTGAIYLFHGGSASDGAFQSNNGALGEYVQVDGTGAAGEIQYHVFEGDGAKDLSLHYPGGHLGYAIAIADLDLDGYADIIASEPDAKTGTSLLRHGRVYVIPGSSSWLSSDRSPATADASLVIETQTAYVRFGTSLTTGDINGDGYPDVVIGSAPTADATLMTSGTLSILFGGPREELYANPDPKAYVVDAERNPPAITGDLVNIAGDPDTWPGLGSVLAAVDLDGDGLDDLAVTLGRLADTGGDATSFEEPYRVLLINGRGLVGLTPGAPIQPNPLDVVMIEGPTDAAFGLELFAADMNGDRRRDLVIGAPLQNGVLSGDPRVGAIYVLYATPRFDYWAARSYDLSMPGTWAATPPPLPVIAVEGTTPHGWYGTGLGTSSHFSFALSAPQYSDHLENRRALSYVFAAGTPNNDGDPVGTIHVLHLPGLFCCGSECPCSNSPLPPQP